MDDMREVLGAPEWYLAADLQTVSFSGDQQCVTFVIHFMGRSHSYVVDSNLTLRNQYVWRLQKRVFCR